MELEAITTGTQDYMAWRALGDIYFDKQQYQLAVECYQVQKISDGHMTYPTRGAIDGSLVQRPRRRGPLSKGSSRGVERSCVFSE